MYIVTQFDNTRLTEGRTITGRRRRRRRPKKSNYLESLANLPGGGGTLIFSHIRRLGLFIWVQNSEFQYFWGFQKNDFFFGGGGGGGV